MSVIFYVNKKSIASTIEMRKDDIVINLISKTCYGFPSRDVLWELLNGTYFWSSCSRVFTNQMGFVIVDDITPVKIQNIIVVTNIQEKHAT